jgi:hypothetical protein
MNKYGRHDFNSDCIQQMEMDFEIHDIFQWRPLQVSNQKLLYVSIFGVIWDPENHYIGSGRISIKHGCRKVYHHTERASNQNDDQSGKHQKQTFLIEEMVLCAWLGTGYDELFLNPADSSKVRIYHTDGNLLHNHLFNLLVVPDTVELSDLHSWTGLMPILERIEPIWKLIDQKVKVQTPRMDPSYSRRIVIEKP